MERKDTGIKRVIHLTNGSQKFLTNCRENFSWLEEVLPTKWIISRDFQHVEEQIIEEFLEAIKGENSLIFFHGLWPTHRRCLSNCKGQNHIKVAFLWGGDYSTDVLDTRTLFEPCTGRLLWQISRKGRFLPFSVYAFIWRKYNHFQLRLRRVRLANLLEQLNYSVVGFGRFEEQILPKSQGHFLPSFNPYYQLVDEGEPFLSEPTDKVQVIEDKPISVLVGNSGFPLLNHMDVVNQLRDNNPKTDFRFNLLVSYGDKEYIERLELHYEKDKDITFIKNFLSIDSFRELISSHDILAMGSMRQQGSGFIREAITHRKQLYLYPESLAYKFLKSQGLEIYSIRQGLAAVKGNALHSNAASFRRIERSHSSDFKVAIQRILQRYSSLDS